MFIQTGTEIPIMDGTIRPFLRRIKSKEKPGLLYPYEFNTNAVAYKDTFYYTKALKDNLVISCTVDGQETTNT